MTAVRKRGAIRLLCGLAAMALAPAAFAQDTLEAGFRNPPTAAKPHTWWHWVNGNISRVGITADLEAMKQVGLGGAQIFNVDVGIPAGPAPFMSPQWRGMIVHAVKEANRLGLDLCIHNGAGWSSSGGPWTTPEHAMQKLVWTEAKAHGPSSFSDTLKQPETVANYYGDIEVLAVRTPSDEGNAPLRISQINVKAAFERGDRILPATTPTPPGKAVAKDGILDITSKMDASGKLTWDVPDGDWTILRIGHTPTGAMNEPAPRSGLGLECDKLSREAMDAHWKGSIEPLLHDLGPLAPKTLNNILIDSYEVGSQNWSPKFREEFQKRRGYDPMLFLPVVTGRVVESVEVSERFLWDLRRTVCDLFADNYYGYLAELCHKYGLKASIEGYGNGSFDNLQAGGRADIPMGEFWVGGGAMETTKLAASSGHIYGRNIIGAESFTADDQVGRWLVDPYSIKALGDMVFCNGVNRYIFHRYAHQPWKNLKPGMTMGPWGTHFERTVTWWNQSAAWLKYVARCQSLLQSGKFVADALYFTGETGPNDMAYRTGLNPTLPKGYDYDGCDGQTLLNSVSVRNGRLVLSSGTSYRVLILPDNTFMTPATASKIRDLIRAGAVVLGPKPTQSPSLADYPRCDEQVRQIADEVWGDLDGTSSQERAFGQGRVIWGKPVKEVFAELAAAPDFTYTGSAGDARLAYIHRATDSAEIYFVSNQRYRTERVTCDFRADGKTPELWHADTGVIENAPIYGRQNGRTSIPMRLGPAESVFVIFRKAAPKADHLASVDAPGTDNTAPAPKIVIRRAFYGVPDGRGADVTAKVAEMVNDGQTSIGATNENFGDPVSLVVKQLTVEYTVDGKSVTRVAPENGSVELVSSPDTVELPDFTLAGAHPGAAVLTAWKPGQYVVHTTAGKSVKVTVKEAARVETLNDDWTLRFPSGWGAPAQVQLARLISWPDHETAGVRFFSGTAEYEKEFDVPADLLEGNRAVLLDLGKVKNFADVTLNGKKLGVLWKAPFVLDVTGMVQAGRNTLSIKVTNLWPNRLIGDAQQPTDDVDWNGDTIAKWPQWLLDGKPRPQTGRYTFATWRFFRKDSPLLESGLIGPVSLRSAPKVTVRY